MATLGETLIRLRNERGLLQKELAATLKVSIGTISNYEKGIHEPDLETLGELADYYGVTTDYLLGRTKYRYSPENLNRPLTEQYTVAEFVNTTLQLPTRDIRSMLEHLELIQTRIAYLAAREAAEPKEKQT